MYIRVLSTKMPRQHLARFGHRFSHSNAVDSDCIPQEQPEETLSIFVIISKTVFTTHITMKSSLIALFAMLSMATGFSVRPTFASAARGRSSLQMSTGAAASTICPLLPPPAEPSETAEFAMG